LFYENGFLQRQKMDMKVQASKLPQSKPAVDFARITTLQKLLRRVF